MARRVFHRSFAGGEMSPEMYGRIDDVKFQNGAATLRNVIAKPQGPALKRPGLQFVRETKDSSNQACLLPFRYSTDQTFVIEAGRSVVDSRGIGYLRFHTQGATLQYAAPPAYVAVMNVSTATTGPYTNGFDPIGDAFLFTANHGLSTGDPVVFTLDGAGALPVQLSENVIYYAIVVDPDELQLATTRANALAGTRINLTGSSAGGPGDRKLHFAYEQGDLVEWSGAGAGNFYCIKRPWDTHLDHPPTDTIYWYREPVDGALPSGGIFEVPHYYAQEDLFDIHWVQSGDVLTLAHPRYPVAELRRLGATRWVLKDVLFNAAVAAPSGINTFATPGQGLRITTVGVLSGPPGPAILTTVTPHVFVPDVETVRVTGLSSQGIPDNNYIVGVASGTTFRIKDVQSSVEITATSTAGGLTTPRVRVISLSTETTNKYVLTALADNGEESPPSAEVSIINNLYVPGAKNSLTWTAVPGAVRYRIYKLLNGLFGYIGETSSSLLFIDDNIAPDLGITPPILDDSLRRMATVTFDLLKDQVNWTGHGLEAGMAVRFDTNGALPTGIEVGVSYYVISPEADVFQVSLIEGGAAINLTGSPSGSHTAVSGHFPAAVTYFEQRRFFGGARVRPQDIWATASGTETDLSFSVPIQDDDRLYFRIAAREGSTIRHIVPLGHLLVLTNSSEYRITALNDDALTPSSISVRPQSYVGASNVQPNVINTTVLFPASRGGHLREIGFNWQLQSFVSGDVSLRAAHLFDDEEIVQQAYAKAPLPIVWMVSTSGDLLGISYVPEEQVGAWHQHVTDGVFESCAAVSEGEEDRLYVVVRRTINGSVVRYVERMGVQSVELIEDAFDVDSGLTYSGVPATTISGLQHIEGKAVSVLADGRVVSGKTVVGGQIILSVPASKVHVGLPYTARIDTLPLVMQIEGWGQGRQNNVNAVTARLFESGRFVSGPTTVAQLVPSPEPPEGSLFTGQVEVVIPASWQYDGQVRIEQSLPLPLTVVGLTIEAATGG